MHTARSNRLSAGNLSRFRANRSVRLTHSGGAGCFRPTDRTLRAFGVRWSVHPNTAVHMGDKNPKSKDKNKKQDDASKKANKDAHDKKQAPPAPAPAGKKK